MVQISPERRSRERTIDSDKLTGWYNFQAPFYHFWRDKYDSRLVHKVASLITDSRKILDAGCGTGLFTIGLARLWDRHLFNGVDRSQGMIEVGRKQAKKLRVKNVSFCLGDVEVLPFAGGSFEAIIAAGLFCNLNEASGTLREFARVLKPGGQLVIVEFDRNSMTPSMRMFFNIMIAGYKVFSSCFRRFQFAKNWDINSSTIGVESFKDTLRAVGYHVRSIESLDSHFVLNCLKGDHECRNSG